MTVETDKKGHVVLERREDAALLFCGDVPEPYVIAHGYEDSGEWSYGTYFSDARDAILEYTKLEVAWRDYEYGACGCCGTDIGPNESYCYACGTKVANKHE